MKKMKPGKVNKKKTTVTLWIDESSSDEDLEEELKLQDSDEDFDFEEEVLAADLEKQLESENIEVGDFILVLCKGEKTRTFSGSRVCSG